MNRNSTKALVLGMMGLAATVTAEAGDKALIEKLVAKGYLTQDEATELRGSDVPVVKPKGKSVEKLTISGRLHYQFDHLDGEAGNTNLANPNHFYFRRLRWGAKADLGNGYYGAINFDFSGGALAIDKAFVGYKHNPAAQFKFGFFKAPFGVEETTSSSKIKAVERSAANRFFADDIDFSARHAGISVDGKFDNGFSYTAMVANSAQGEGSRLGGSTSASNRIAGFGRVQFNTKVDDTKIKIGVDGGYQPDNQVVIGSGGDVMAGTAYAQITAGGLFIQPEIFFGEIDYKIPGSVDSDVLGYSILASYKVGDFEPVVRYSYMDGDTFGIDTDELIRRGPAGVDNGGHDEIDSFFIGFNYYIIGNDLKFSGGYEYAKSTGPGVADSEIQGFRGRLQFLF